MIHEERMWSTSNRQQECDVLQLAKESALQRQSPSNAEILRSASASRWAMSYELHWIEVWSKLRSLVIPIRTLLVLCISKKEKQTESLRMCNSIYIMITAKKISTTGNLQPSQIRNSMWRSWAIIHSYLLSKTHEVENKRCISSTLSYLVGAIDTLFAEQLKQLKPNVLSATSNNKQKFSIYVMLFSYQVLSSDSWVVSWSTFYFC